MIKVYAPKMGIALPLDEESLYRIYNNFFGQEVSYAKEAEEIKNNGGPWESIEDIANRFANAADELSEFADRDAPDYALLSQLVDECILDSVEEYPEYHQWYTEDGKPTDF